MPKKENEEKRPIRKATLLQAMAIVAANFQSTLINRVIVPCLLLGAPGIGKTAFARLIGAQVQAILAHRANIEIGIFGFRTILIIPSQCMPIDEQQSRPETSAEGIRKLVKFYSDLIPFNIPCFIIVDEYADLPPNESAVFRALLMEHKWGDQKLHADSYVIATGNLPEHHASALEIPCQTLDGGQVIHVRGDSRVWLDHFAYPNGIDPVLCAFVEFNLAMEIDIVADGFNADDYAAGATARSLHQLSSAMNTDSGRAVMSDPITQEIMVDGQLGQVFGIQFRAFRKLSTIDPQAILAKPDTAAEPTRLEEKFALIGLLSSVAAENSNAQKILTYAKNWDDRPLACHMIETCIRRNASLRDSAFHREANSHFGDLTF